MPDNISKLYQELKGTYELGSENDFRKYLSDGNKREALRKELASDYEVGDSASFTKYLGLNTKPKTYNKAEDNVGASVGTAVFQNPRQTKKSTPQQGKPADTRTSMPNGFGELNMQQAQQIGLGKGPVSWEHPEMPDHQETVVEKQQRMLQGKATPQEQKQVQNRLQQRKDEIAYEQETGKRLRHPVLNTDFEAPTLSHDENGNPLIGNTTDQDRVSSHQQVMAEQAEWDSLSDEEKRERKKQMQLQREMDEYEEPGFLGVTGKKLASGFINAGLGLFKTMEELTSGMIVEDASSPTGYSRTPDFDPNSNDAITSGLRNAGEYAERLSRQGEPRKGASFTDLLMSGDISGFLLKGWGTGMESAPMTLSAYNPYTMALNAISMAGNNYWQETMENPDIPTWKRATYAIGTAAIEQAVEKFADPVFKYIGGGMGKKVVQEVTEEAEKTIAKRIVNVLKDAAGEGAEEIITNFGNDTLGQALDWLDGASDYGLVAQWRDFKKQNPNASLSDFAFQKADETMNSFFGGALAGAYTSGGAQATVAGLQYAIGRTSSPEQIINNPNQPVHPATLDIAQSFDRGYGLEKDEDKTAAADKYSAYRSRMEAAVGEEVLSKIDANPTAALSEIGQLGLDEEGQRILGEYIGAKAEFDGIQQRIIEDNRASRPNYVVNGNNIDEVDAEGNVVNTHEYANEDEMKAGLWELQAKRDYQDMQADINMIRLNPKYDYDALIGGFAEEIGLDVDYIESILNKDPLELSDPESAMVSEFADLLHSTLYDNTEIHEEQSTQDGAKLADAMSIDINDISEDNAAQAQQLMNELNAAQQALNDAFAKNEDLKQEVESMEQQGMPHQGIIASLDSFRPAEVQAVIDFYNATAKFDGFRNQMAQKIDEEAANSTKRHTLNGTINGQADLGNIYTISDGTNEYYLVSGNITTDSATGQITGSTSGLIIGMDLDGSFVQIGDTNGYSLTPNVISAAQFEEQERIRLQEAWSVAIDPNGAAQAATGQQATEQSGNAGGEAGATTGTGANEPPAPAPVLSDETNEYGKRFVVSADGSTTFGEITADSGLTPAPIKLSEGEDRIDEHGRHHGYGLKHIEASHGDQIRKAGYSSVQSFVEDVARNYDTIREGNPYGDSQSYLLEITDEKNNTVFVELSRDGNYWNVNSAGIFRKSYSRNKKEVQSLPTIGSDANAATTGVNHGQTEGATVTSENSPLTSGDKDTENIDTNQEINVKVDKNGVKLYEEGTPLDAAIDDIQRDGFDVNEIADASIAENQAVIDKINNKLVKTRLDIINRKKAQDAIDYYTQLKARWAEVNQPEGEPSGTVANSEESINNEPQPSQSEGNVVPSRAQGETQTGKPSGTLTVEEQKQERIKALKAELRELFDDDFTKANDVYELVSMWVGRKRNLAWDDVNGKRGLQKELGWQRKIGGDTKFIETLLAKKGEGVGVDEFVHMVWESPENDVMGEKRFSTEEIKEALLELLTSARSKSDVVDHALNSRERIARQLLEEQQQMEQEMHESGETVVDEEPGDVDWSDMPFPPTMTDEEVANDEFLKHFDENGTYTYTSNDTERELSESSRLVHESESGGIDRENSESGGVDRESQLPISSAVGGNLSEGGPGTSTEEKADSNTQPSNSVDVGQRQTTGASEVQTAMGAGSRTEQSQGSTQSAVEEYLQPRDAEEEKIIADVHAQLQQEIQGAINEQNKARSELQKAQARESERATDLFGNDNALNQPGQLFDNSDMPVDQSMEGVERRTAAERQRLQEATNKLNQLQSEQERNSRIRGALDNHRRQTTIDTDNPMKAISQASESWRRDNMPKEINNFINGLADRFGLKGAVSTFVINSKEDLEAMRGKVSSRAFKDIEELYNEPDTGAGYIPRADIVVVFGEKIEDVKEAESIWWHEQAHGYWETLSKGQRESFGKACLDYLFRHHRADYNHIINDYPEEDHLNEACSFFIAQLISEHGTEKILGSRFEGIEEICNFADGLTNYIRNEREQGKGIQRNPLRYGGAYRSVNGAAQVDGRNSQEREGRGDSLRSEKESEITDPLEAIEQSAKRYRRDRAESEGMTPEAHSAKAVYDERLNRVETVFTEAYQDSMVALKTAQNAIAGDEDIPDSQNAYMAENLMHGKNKNEQDLFNSMFRDPLIKTINKIMNLTGMNWGDIDRYVYTKSGLERNREFYVRDWLEAQRGKTAPHSYEDLNDAEQSIFNVYAAHIEEDFEDGIIATEEEKQKKLSQALQKAHEEYVNQIEQEYLSIKSERYLDLRDNVITFPEYLEAIDNFIRRTIDYGYEAEAHDYSGFRAMFGDEEGKYSEAEIIEELMETEAQMDEGPDGEPSGTVTELWEQIQDATRYGLERYREAGMRSDEQIDQIEQMFHWYVPMRGFTVETGEDMYQYFTGKGKAKSYVGGLLKHAKGRGSEASYPISTIFAMTYKAISDCNQNLVNQKLYRLCQAHPNDLVILSDSWARLNPMTGEWEEVGPDITEDMDEEEIREATLAWEEEMRQMASAGNAKKITGKARFDYKPMDKKNQSEHIVDVRINGQPRRMIVTGNPRMAQALNGQLKFEHGRNVFSKWNNYIKNKMATFFTSYSPTFAMRNMFRDWTHFRTMLGVREGHGYASQANKYYRQSLFKMAGLFKKYREGTLDESKEMERDFKDFMDNGGITGFVFMQKIDDIQKEMENIYKKQKAGKPIRLNNNLWEKILGAVEALNEGIENNARFATYRASRHYAGRTKARSAYDAKEITVNFNRKGAGSKTAGFKSQSKRVEDAAKAFGVTSQILGEGRIFFNATVQAIATTFKNFQNPDGSINGHYVANWAMKYALPPFAFGLALPAINKALAAAFGGDDDDPYANLAEWTRRKNICIYIGNGNFITIPIGQELAAFLTLGDIAAGMTYAPDLKPVDRTFDQEMVEVMNTFSPVDISTKITKGGLMEDPISEVTGRTFSVLAPLVAVEQNLGWTGRPIYREDKFKNDQYSPEYQMAYSGTNPVLVNASKLLHEIGGGDDVTRGNLEVNPAIIQYLWEQYTGGPGKVFSNTISIGKDAKDILTGNESDFNVRKVEGLKAFVQQGDDRTQFYRANAKYRKYKADAEKLYDAVKGYESGAAENPEYLLKLEQISKGEDFVRMQIVREADKTLNQINKAANKAEGKERKVLRRLYNEQVKQVVDMLDSVNE